MHGNPEPSQLQQAARHQAGPLALHLYRTGAAGRAVSFRIPMFMRSFFPDYHYTVVPVYTVLY